jgi:glycosyltransferase involved in cell wall biosynthesis
VLVLHIISNLERGGAEGVLFRLCTADRSSTHVVISLTTLGHYGPLLRTRQIAAHSLCLIPGRLNLSGLMRLFALLRRYRPDIVQTWMYHADLIGGVVARLAGIRNVFWGVRHGLINPGALRQTTRFVVGCCALLSGLIPQRVVSCSELGAKAHVDMGYAAEKLRVIPNGFDIDVLSIDLEARRAFRAAEGISETVPLFGMVARFDPHKDHETLIRALAILKKKGSDFLCLLAGSGMDSTNLTLLSSLEQSSVADRVTLLGARDDIPSLMNALDIHVLSSKGEAFPNVLGEAMACGTPCVATEVGDARLIIGTTGWLTPPGNASALAEALDSALEEMGDASAWQHRSKVCRDRIVGSYSIATMLSAYSRVWQGEV